MKIKTSVIIPVYNTAPYIRECIESVFQQTQKEIEVIAVDDGSTDESLSVLLEMRKKYPDLIVIAQKNRRQGYARNVGMKIASGEYIYFLDSDDYIMENTLEQCYECAAKNKLDIVMFDALEVEDTIERKPIEPNYNDRRDIIREGEEVFSGIFFLEKYYQKTYNPCTCFVYCSADFLRKNNIWFLSGVYFEDNEFYCRIMTLAERVMYIPQMFYRCRCRESSTTRVYFDSRKAHDHIEVIGAIADLKSLHEGKGWDVLKKISMNLLCYVASVCHTNKLYYEDQSLARQILETWTKICGQEIEETEKIEDIDCIYDIFWEFPDADLYEKKEAICIRRRQLLKQLLEQTPLNCRESKVAIYGCGQYTNRFLNLYEELVGAISADIIFLDSNIKCSNERFRGCPVFHISEVKGKELDCVLISSPLYEKEMNDTLQDYCGNKFLTVKLYGDLHINI